MNHSVGYYDSNIQISVGTYSDCIDADIVVLAVDAMTYLVKSISGLPDSKVMGTGTALDSARLRYFLADLIGVDARSLEAMYMGNMDSPTSI